MILINPVPEKDVSDDKIFRILKAVCQSRNEEKIVELRKLCKILEIEK